MLSRMTGFAILAGVDSPGAKYFGCFLIASGIYPNVPQGVAWNGNNIGGSVKRGVGIAMHVGFVSTSGSQFIPFLHLHNSRAILVVLSPASSSEHKRSLITAPAISHSSERQP